MRSKKRLDCLDLGSFFALGFMMGDWWAFTGRVKYKLRYLLFLMTKITSMGINKQLWA
jgi:hypothetical protein